MKLKFKVWDKENKINGIYVEFEFEPKYAVVPENSDGKFRVSKAKCIGLVKETYERI